MVLVFAIVAKAEDQKRKKGFRGKGLGEEKGKKWKNPRKTLPTREKRGARGTKKHTNDIQRNAVMWTVPDSSYSEENYQGGRKPYLWGLKGVESESTNEQGS